MCNCLNQMKQGLIALKIQKLSMNNKSYQNKKYSNANIRQQIEYRMLYYFYYLGSRGSRVSVTKRMFLLRHERISGDITVF